MVSGRESEGKPRPQLQWNLYESKNSKGQELFSSCYFSEFLSAGEKNFYLS